MYRVKMRSGIKESVEGREVKKEVEEKMRMMGDEEDLVRIEGDRQKRRDTKRQKRVRIIEMERDREDERIGRWFGCDLLRFSREQEGFDG